jgi:hypothetical protein
MSTQCFSRVRVRCTPNRRCQRILPACASILFLSSPCFAQGAPDASAADAEQSRQVALPPRESSRHALHDDVRAMYESTDKWRREFSS